MSKPPIYERGVPQGLREELRHRLDRAIAEDAMDRLLKGNGTGRLRGVLGPSAEEGDS